MSTKTGSSRVMVVSESAWLAVTSAPSVTVERPIRPLIGAGTRVKRRLTWASRSAAEFCATEASACRAWATASV
jgi:hypothetical protein